MNAGAQVAEPGGAKAYICNIDIDIILDIEVDETMDEDELPCHRMSKHSHGHWMRHMAAVPKGFLRSRLLKMLDEKPMSGSEIMSEIEKQTNGDWKPSPGSIYPLLAWLQDKGYIKQAPEQELGTKRYVLTDQGKTFLEEQVKTGEEFGRRHRHFGFGSDFLGPMGFQLNHEEAGELRKATRDLAEALWGLRSRLGKQDSAEAVEEAKKTLEEATKQIEDITKKLEN